MSALALYRKYRPTTLEDVVGQEHIIVTLRNALRLGRVGHAYLFAGPRGTGKTTVARLLARYVNCAVGEADQVCSPASACMHCAAFLAGNNPDLIELDAASNRGIDEIRQLRESVRVAPFQSQRKVYVIDEAHMLTKEAANALLKTLEEPPSHVMFILATTDAEKLPPTIHSRCQRFDFRLLAVPEIHQRLTRLAGAEGVTIADDAAELLAQAAEGSLRDGESMLQQVLAFIGRGASGEDCMKLLGIPDPVLVHALAEALVTGNRESALERIAKAMERGGGATALAIKLASYLRDVLLMKADPQLASMLEKREGSGYLQNILRLSHIADQHRLLKLIPKCIEAAELTKRSPIPQLPLELVVIESSLTNS